jgi:tetratricopeptide (TPR) repeat protein
MPPQPAGRMVPVPAEEFARRRRRPVLIWSGAAVAVIGIAWIAWQQSSRPADAQNLVDANRLFETAKYNDALLAVNRAIDENVNPPDSYRLRASIYKFLGRPKDALADLDRVIELEPNVLAHYRTRAQLHMDLGNIDRALEDYTVLIERNGEASAYTGRALCYRKMGQLDKAIADLGRSMEREATVENNLQRGLAYAEMGDHRKAIADFDRAIEINPNLSQIYRARATAKQALGDWQGAERDRAKAYQLETPVPEPAPGRQ